METFGGASDPHGTSDASGPVGNGGSSRRYAMQLLTSSFIHAPLTALLEYSGVLRPRSSNNLESDRFLSDETGRGGPELASVRRELSSSSSGGGDGEVLIRIIVPGDHVGVRAGGQGPAPPSARVRSAGENSAASEEIPTDDGGRGDHGRNEYRTEELCGLPATQVPSVPPVNTQSSHGDANPGGANSSESSYQRFDIQQLAKWVEQILPFSLLLLVVFIRQHLQGFFVTIWIAAVMFKSNDMLRKQTALKGERKMPVLVGITVIFMLHVFGIYWLYRNDDLLDPLVLLPPKEIPPFWHAVFIILVNGEFMEALSWYLTMLLGIHGFTNTMVRQAAMVLKCVLLMRYRNSRGRSYRKQGQMLTLLEYFLLLYRALLPTPVWYRFFLNKEYGSLFSSLITGLYLTIKLTSVVEKIQSFLAAVKALSYKDAHYGSHPTSEQVTAAGDLCAICQEKMQAPILLRCKHIFCEDCVSEWFDRERTCPLCRAIVKPAGLRSFGDGSTSLFFQLF